MMAGRSQMGLGNEDLDNGSDTEKKSYELPVMNRELIEGSGLTVRDAIAHIVKCKELKETDPDQDI